MKSNTIQQITMGLQFDVAIDLMARYLDIVLDLPRPIRR
jgi:hypothetical protein